MTLKSRITTAAISATLLVAVVLLIAGKLAQEAVEMRFEEAAITGKSVLWEKIINSQLDQMEANTRSIARDRETLKALKNGDLALLAENAITTYNLLSAENVISELQMVDVNGQVVFSSSNGKKGSTRKLLPSLALSEGKIARGIERDDNNKLYAELAFPVYYRGKPVGVTVFQRNLQPALEDFKVHDLSESFILNEKGDKEYGTNDELFNSINIELPALGSTATTELKLNDIVYSVVIQPVEGADNRILAHQVSLKDQTNSYNAQQAINLVSYALIGIVLLVSSVTLIWYLRRSFKPLGLVVENMMHISRGDLTRTTNATDRDDETGQLMRAMGMMTTNLRNIVGEVHQAADVIRNASEEISRGNVDLSTRTEEQASSLEETAASMEEMTGTIKQNAESTKLASDITNSVRGTAEKGLSVMGQAESAMIELNDSSNKIVDIISTIDSIAFQTNLLALNAAVESARAGEQGRGFAVVANEVRNLAKKSADAAKEIKLLIENSVEKVNTSTDLVSESSKSLGDIVDGIKKVADLVAETNASSQEQSRGIDQVNTAVTRMDTMTQQNAALVEESAASSRAMLEQAVQLGQVIEQFKLTRDDTGLVLEDSRDSGGESFGNSRLTK